MTLHDPSKATEQELIDFLNRVREAVRYQFATSNPTRLEQVTGALDTAAMGIGYLFHEVPYIPGD